MMMERRFASNGQCLMLSVFSILTCVGQTESYFRYIDTRFGVSDENAAVWFYLSQVGGVAITLLNLQ